jgi:RNA-directed DNA polymerase
VARGNPRPSRFWDSPTFCGNLTSSGAFNVWRLTAKKRMVAQLNVIKAELQHRKHHEGRRHMAPEVVQGYYQYHAVPGNTGQLRVFRRREWRLRRSVLVRRSQRAQVGWDRLNPLLNRWIPHPHALHPYPDKRFDAIHPR